MKIFALLASALLAVALITSCTDDDNEVGLEDRERSEGRIAARLDDIDRRILDARARIQRQGGAVQDDLDERLDAIEESREDIDDDVRDLRNSDEDEWVGKMKGIEEALGDIEEDLDELIRG